MALSTNVTISQSLAHLRADHLCPRLIKRLPDTVRGLKISPNTEDIKDNIICKGCAQAKMTRNPFYPRVNRAKCFQIVWSDEQAHSPYRHWLGTGTCCPSSMITPLWVLFFRYKPEVPKLMKLFERQAFRQRGSRIIERIRTWRTDNGTEFFNKALGQYYDDQGIIHESSVPYNPE